MSFPDHDNMAARVACALVWLIVSVIVCFLLFGCATHTVYGPDGKPTAILKAVYPYEITVGPLTARPNETANATVQTLGTELIKVAPDAAAKAAESLAERSQP